jgi:hypothetical protein
MTFNLDLSDYFLIFLQGRVHAQVKLYFFRIRDMFQVAEHLCTTCKALRFNPHYHKKTPYLFWLEYNLAKIMSSSVSYMRWDTVLLLAMPSLVGSVKCCPLATVKVLLSIYLCMHVCMYPLISVLGDRSQDLTHCQESALPLSYNHRPGVFFFL